MFNDLFYITLITAGIVFILTLIGIIVAITFKWKLYKYILLLLIPLLGFPVIFLLTNNFFHSKYNYHIVVNSHEEIMNILAGKYQRPELIPNGENFNLYHSSSEWYFRCILDDQNFQEMLSLKDKNYLIKLEINNSIDKNDLKYFNKIDTNNFEWNKKYESRINANGSRVFVLRNAISNETYVYRNRF